MYCIEFPHPDIPPSLYGSKAAALNKTSQLALVSKGFSISTKAYDDFISSNNLGKEILRNLSAFLNGDISSRECSSAIQEKFHAAVFASNLRDELFDLKRKFLSPFIVRSSSTVEDSPLLSFAGLFDSCLFVGENEVEEAIKKVFSSVFNSRLLEYSREYKIDLLGIKMAVLVQEMLQGDKFGVAFSFNDPDQKKVMIVESVINDPSGVTSGKMTPDTYVLRENIRFAYPAIINLNSLFEFETTRIAQLLTKVDDVFFPVDIEWGFLSGDLYLLQARPLTREIPIPLGTENFAGLPASQGIVSGEAVIWGNDGSLIGDKNKILLAEEIEISDVEIVKEYGGLVLEISGMTAHAAILAREYGVPCIVGVNGITKIVQPGEIVYIDGSTGEINLPERKGYSIKRKYVPTYIAPDRLEYFRFGDETLLVYPEQNCVLLYHPSLREELEPASRLIREKYKKPVIDGGVDIWYGYNTIIEMGVEKHEIRRDFLHGLDVTSSLDIEKINLTAREFISKGTTHCQNAEAELNDYETNEQENHLIRAYEEAESAFAYWRIVQYSMMYDYAENIAYNNPSSPVTNDFQKLAIGFQEDKDLFNMGTLAMELIDKITAKIRIAHGIDVTEFSSLLAVVEKILVCDCRLFNSELPADAG